MLALFLAIAPRCKCANGAVSSTDTDSGPEVSEAVDPVSDNSARSTTAVIGNRDGEADVGAPAHSTRSVDTAHIDWSFLKDEDFGTFSAGFAEAWDRNAVETLRHATNKTGFWLISTPASTWEAERVRAPYNDLFPQDPLSGFSRVGLLGFKCVPVSGPQPVTSGNCREPRSTCAFGNVDAARRAQVERQTSVRVSAHDSRFSLSGVSKFLSDREWGAVFYFGRTSLGWRIFALSTPDCLND